MEYCSTPSLRTSRIEKGNKFSQQTGSLHQSVSDSIILFFAFTARYMEVKPFFLLGIVLYTQ
jgi:hypothetical protein